MSKVAVKKENSFEAIRATNGFLFQALVSSIWEMDGVCTGLISNGSDTPVAVITTAKDFCWSISGNEPHVG